MPKVSGLEVLKWIQTEQICVNPLVVSMHADDLTIRNIITSGALGFMNKTDNWNEMYNAIKTVAEGEFYYPANIQSILLKMTREQAKNPKSQESFDERELNIIRYLNDGLNSSEIAEKLYCSRATVDRIRQTLIHRVGARNTIGLLSYINQQGLLKENSF